MDFGKLMAAAAEAKAMDVVAAGLGFLQAVRDNAALAKHVLTDGDRAEIDAIHARALAQADALDTDLAAAERR